MSPCLYLRVPGIPAWLRRQRMSSALPFGLRYEVAILLLISTAALPFPVRMQSTGAGFKHGLQKHGACHLARISVAVTHLWRTLFSDSEQVNTGHCYDTDQRWFLAAPRHFKR